MADLIGTLLDHFQVVELLGRGGMGAVYKARDLRLERDVAIKVMHPHVADQGDFKERFLQEARSAARLDHPGIVDVYHFGQARDLLYIVMEFIPGANLREMLESLKTTDAWVPLEEAIQLVRQVGLALDYAHRKGVLHRDIKPKNIMIEPEPSDGLPYRPVITDLGLAKLADSDFVTRAGSSMGTPAYMSPEQAVGEPTDARSDVYSLGVLLFELTVGRPPFPAKTITEAIRYHTQEPPPAPRSLRSDLPESVERIILKALEKAPEQRFADAAAFAEALTTVDAEVAALAATPTVVGSAVSLMTQYQDSLVRPRGPSLLESFDTPPDLSEDSIQVLVDGRTVATVPIEEGPTTIGRQDDNDIVLDDPKASRHHAQVAFDGHDYRVVDLGSSNGTYLADAKLLPGVAEVWTPDQALRIGDTVLRLVVVRRRTTEAATHPGAARGRDVTQVTSGGSWVGLLMAQQQLVVEPGARVTATVTVLNQGPLVDHFDVTVEKVPSGWVSVSPPSVQLLPGQQLAVTVTLRPPRTPESRAGEHPLSIRVTSQSDPAQTAQIDASLAIDAYYQAELNIRPRRENGIAHGQFTLRVNNQCNAGLTMRFEAVDPEDACRFSFEPAQISVPAGETQEAKLSVSPTTPLRGESARTYPFTVTARADEAPELTRQVQGTWVQTPPAYDVALRPETQSTVDRATYEVHVVNRGEADLALELDAMDAEGGCRFEFDPPQPEVPAGQESAIQLTVLPRAPLPSSGPKTYRFTVTLQPSGVPGFTQQVQGAWERTTPPPAPGQQPVESSPSTEPAEGTTQTKRRWLGGCIVLLIGLALSVGAFFLVGRFVFEELGFPNEVAWVAALGAGLSGLVATLALASRVWRKRP